MGLHAEARPSGEVIVLRFFGFVWVPCGSQEFYPKILIFPPAILATIMCDYAPYIFTL